MSLFVNCDFPFSWSKHREWGNPIESLRLVPATTNFFQACGKMRWMAGKVPPDSYSRRIRRGIDQIERKDAPFAEILNQWLEQKVKPAFVNRLLAVTPVVADLARETATGRT